MTAEPDDAEVACPFCGSTDVELDSRFGGEISKQAFFCHSCTSPFERLKYDGRRPDTGR